MLTELDPVDRVTADAVGPPGERVFYLQGRKGDQLVTLIVEKQQVQLLAASVVEILSRIGKETGQGPPDDAMKLEEPLVPEWRAGRLSIGYSEDRDLLVLEAEELLPDQDDDEQEPSMEEAVAEEPELAEGNGHDVEDEQASLEDTTAADVLEELEAMNELPDLEGMASPREPGRVRFWATREQMLSLARHGAAVCAQGRPRCQLCGNPLEPEGHRCPALNGHRELKSE